MKVLSINAGSSSLKLGLYNMPEGILLVSAIFERIGLDNSSYTINMKGSKIKNECLFNDYEKAIDIFLKELINNKVINSIKEIKGLGHRVVHGKDKYTKSVIINDEVMADIDEFSSLAPLHNPANLIAIKAFKKVLPHITSVAIFDTAFYQSMKSDSYIYPIPYEWYHKYGVRKYGFHGISHQYITKRLNKILSRQDLKIISCHLGNGSSITAINSGRVIDTSMGFTPVSGVPMGTRCGDIDVSIIPYIMKQTNKDINDVMNDLNNNSGLLGISEVSSDLRDIEEAIKQNNERCKLAVDIYVKKIISFISYYNVILDKADVIVFTAGIGENSSMVRELILKNLKSLGVIIDKERNNIKGQETLISSKESSIKCYVIPTSEELMIAEEVYKFIR